MENVAVSIIATEAASAVAAVSGLENKLKAAMEKSVDHWLAPGENAEFLGAVTAVYKDANDEDRERIKAELESIKFLNAMLGGVPVDLSQMPVLENPIGLMKIWQEIRGARA